MERSRDCQKRSVERNAVIAAVAGVLVTMTPDVAFAYEQKPPPRTTPLERLDQPGSIRDRVTDASVAHVFAVGRCDARAAKEALNELERLEHEARRTAEAARAAGDFATVNPEDAEEDYRDAQDAVWRARARALQDCPDSRAPEAESQGVETAPPASPESDIRTNPFEGVRVKDGGMTELPPSTLEPDLPPIEDVLEDMEPPEIPPEGWEALEEAFGPGEHWGIPGPRFPWQRRILTVHNRERTTIGLPPLRWDPALQTAATGWAVQLARTGRLAHAPREGRGITRENLSQGMIGWSPEQMTGSWVREKSDFFAGVYPNVTRTGRWQDVSHYTQMIWPTTTHIGCGMATGSGYQWLVCRYSPGGNKAGQRVGVPQNPM